jgi:hypothetical protein
MVTWLRANGLSIVLALLFLAFMAGQTWAGWRHYNDELSEHEATPLSLSEYVRSGHFWEATAENWESEFLQMAAYVLLTIGLFQKGSSESKKLDEKEAVDQDPRDARGIHLTNAPGPVRRGGWLLAVYEHSLSIAFLALFLLSFWFHAVGGTQAHNAEEALHGGDPMSVGEYLATSQFWFESFQNWQSEFLAIASMVWLASVPQAAVFTRIETGACATP